MQPTRWPLSLPPKALAGAKLLGFCHHLLGSDSCRHPPSYLDRADHCAKGKHGGRIPQGGLAVKGPLRVHQQHCDLRGRKLHVSLDAPIQHLHPSKITLECQRGLRGECQLLYCAGNLTTSASDLYLVEDEGKEQQLLAVSVDGSFPESAFASCHRRQPQQRIAPP